MWMAKNGAQKAAISLSLIPSWVLLSECYHSIKQDVTTSDKVDILKLSFTICSPREFYIAEMKWHIILFFGLYVEFQSNKLFLLSK